MNGRKALAELVLFTILALPIVGVVYFNEAFTTALLVYLMIIAWNTYERS